MLPIIDEQDISGANQLRDKISKYTNKSYAEICHRTISDPAAVDIARILGHDQDICGIHSSDIIPRSAIGNLTRSRNKEVIHPFVTGQTLRKKPHLIGVYFPYGKREDKLHQLGKAVDMVPIKIQVDHNDTRVMAHYMLLLSLLRVNHGLKLCNQAKTYVF